MPAYKHLIFDLDHTLWDFTANSNATLSELYQVYSLDKHGIVLPQFLEVYQQINDEMWYDYNRKCITKEDIRDLRFKKTLAGVGVVADDLADAINVDYLAICPSKGYLVPYAMEMLQYLSGKYRMHILTNGFSETQHIKLSTSGLQPFFEEVVNSESCGHLKPDREIFDFTLQKIKALHSECIMIGDDLHADALGAKNVGIDSVYFNRKNELHPELLSYEITCLSQLRDIL